jgi:zinc transporter ZupT
VNNVVFYSLVLFGSSIAGGIIFQITRSVKGGGLKLTLSFSAAYLLGLTLLHLFPELFASDLSFPSYWVLGGFMLQVVLDFFSHGIEHGHAHTHKHASQRFFLMIMFSLWVHAFIEGMPFGAPNILGHAHDHGHGHGHAHVHEGHDHRSSLLIGISLHKVTESLVFLALLINSGFRLAKAWLWLVLFGLIAPAGAFVHFFIGDTVDNLAPAVIGILIGILLHVSTTILFESEEGHKFNWMKFASILAGIGLAMLVAH